MRPNDLLIVEYGVDWTAWRAARGSDASADLITVLQQPDEPAERFAARVEQRVARLVERDARIRHVGILGADDWAVPTLRARVTILRAVCDSGLRPAPQIEMHLDGGPTRARAA